MKIKVLTLFPHFYDSFLDTSIIKRAVGKGIVDFSAVDIRSFTKDKYGRVDSAPVGGGAGLIEQLQPLVDCLKASKGPNAHVVFFTPRGHTYKEEDAVRFAKMDELILVCGHYEGVDERFLSYVDEELSIGDYILTGGEIPAMAVADSVIRLLPGAIASESLEDESFTNSLLEYPQYAEPYEYDGMKIPDILYSGNHEAIRKWRKKEAFRITRERRPDLYAQYPFSKADKKLIRELDEGVEEPDWLKKALQKGHKFIKKD